MLENEIVKSKERRGWVEQSRLISIFMLALGECSCTNSYIVKMNLHICISIYTDTYTDISISVSLHCPCKSISSCMCVHTACVPFVLLVQAVEWWTL